MCVAISRRTVLKATAAALGAPLAAGCAPAPAPPASPPPPAPAPSTTGPAPPDWPALRARLAGTLTLPDDAGYDTARRSYNTVFDGRRPAAVASCPTPADVQACLDVARTAGLPVAARSGGHSYAGYSVPDGGLVIDVRPMAAVRVDPDGTATVGAGARLGEIYEALAAAGRCLPAGSCPTVGIAGLTLGGGIGVLSRAYGLTCDQLRAAAVVTPDAVTRTASDRDDPDLFWALRGGGGGNAAVATSFTFATAPAPTVTVFSLRYPAGAAVDVLGAWQAWLGGAPDELWSTCVLSAGPAPGAKVSGSFLGGESACREQLAGLLAATRPDATEVSTMDYLGAMRWFGGSGRRAAFVASSRVLPAPLAKPAALVGLLRRPGVDVLLDPFGGAMGRVDPAATAFPHRTAFASAQIYASAADGAPAAAEEVGMIRDELGRLTGPIGYVNYIDPAMPDWEQAYYGDNLARLRGVVGRYDPDRLLAFPQGVARA